MKISMKLVDQYMVIFFNFQTTSNHLHPLQVENCDSNSRLVVDEDGNGKFRLERAIKWRSLKSRDSNLWFLTKENICNLIATIFPYSFIIYCLISL